MSNPQPHDDLGVKAIGPLEFANEDTGEVTAIVATLGVKDRDHEVILPDAIPHGAAVKLSDYGHSAIMAFMHGMPLADDPPVGKGAIYIDGDKAVFRGRYFMSTASGREAHARAKEMGAEQEWSFGYRILKTAMPDEDMKSQGVKRVLVQLHPFEVSPVLIAGGVGTRTVGVKEATAADAIAAAEAEALVARQAAEATAVQAALQATNAEASRLFARGRRFLRSR